MFSLLDSVKQAYSQSDNQELKAELFLSIYRKNQLSNQYAKAVKGIAKTSKRMDRLMRKSDAKDDVRITKLRAKLENLDATKVDCIGQAVKLRTEINNTELIAQRFIARYRQGLMIADYFKKLYSTEASYGRLLYEVFRKRGKKYFVRISAEDKRLKDKSFLDTEQGARLMESHFVIFLLNLYTKDLSEEDLKELLDEIIREVGGEDVDLKQKLKGVYKGGKLTGQFSKIVLQIARLSVGKGVFMNAAVKTTNIALRAIRGKGMTFARNAAFRKVVVRSMGSGPAAILINAVLFIPDLASVLNKRDYLGIVNSIVILHFLRLEGLTSI